jgi:hypothetical protein
MFFSGGGGGGEEELQDTTSETFSQDDTSSKQPCFIYYILRSGFFRWNMSSDHRDSRRGSSNLDYPGQTRLMFD